MLSRIELKQQQGKESPDGRESLRVAGSTCTRAGVRIIYLISRRADQDDHREMLFRREPRRSHLEARPGLSASIRIGSSTSHYMREATLIQRGQKRRVPRMGILLSGPANAAPLLPFYSSTTSPPTSGRPAVARGRRCRQDGRSVVYPSIALSPCPDT
jgi:hypothetical protein